MPKNLLIVESPAKAKTIEKYLGKDFTVKSSYGHIRDLAKGNSAVDVENNFKLQYIIPDDKKKLVNELKSLVKKYDDVWLATDEDREGEAISWHLCEVLGLDEKTTKRIAFREITKDALQSAIQTPRLLDVNLVDAQQARRVLDRLVGFELSSLVWRKVAGGSGLSAGRVQSVAVKLIVERERAIQNFDTKPFFKVASYFFAKNHLGRKTVFKAELGKKYDSEKAANAFLTKCIKANYSVNDIKVRPTKRKPAAPFTTSTLQQEASRKLGFSVTRTMSNAQRLYEAGHITYMRTDSTNLSQTAMQNIASTITNEYGSNYVQTRVYKKKNAELAQEAHEAIRPTFSEKQNVASDRDQQRLYELIWKRTVASQMADAQVEKTTAKIGISTVSELLTANGAVIKFDGFLKVYLESTDEDEDQEDTGMLPPLKVGQPLDLKETIATQRFTRSLPRFTEASLVKKLEELGIGRPSTYAPTISKITEKGRGYVVKESRDGRERKYQVLTLKDDKVAATTQTETTGTEKNKLFPSDKGKLVVDFLSEHFEDVMDYNFTADIEKRFDKIAHGSTQWQAMLKDFYGSFHETVETTLKDAERASGERILGKDPESGRTILVRMSRNGAVAQIGKTEELGEDEKPRYANLKHTMSIETITLQESLDLFKLPVTLGQYEEQDVIINEGRFGPYVRFDDKYISLDKGEDPMEVSMVRAVELIEAKRKADAPIAKYKDLDVQQGSGRFGPFLKWNSMFINIPKRYDPAALSIADINELIAAKEEKEANRIIQQWEDEKITVENARWGPIIKFKKKKVKIPKNDDGKRMTPEEAKEMTLEAVKALIVAEIPNAFKAPAKRKPAAKKKTTAKKKPAAKKKTTTKKK
jgi:DNA topoisomerase-1